MIARRLIGLSSFLAVALVAAASCGPPELRYEEEPDGTGARSSGDGGRDSAGGAAGAVSDLCRNGEPDGDETDEDCGGSCPPCDDGSACQVDADCSSENCIGLVCYTPGCDNGVVDDDEAGKDCGGVCDTRCPAGETCDVDADCESRVCTAKVCVEESCSDSVENGSETGVDCGGSNPACARCGVGQDCLLDSDCETQSCVDGLCAVVCQPNFADCDGAADTGCEANLLTSIDHCGDCATRCDLPHAISSCSAGACVIATDADGLPRCAAPYAACDTDTENGCEVNLDTDPENCGACGIRCTDANGTPACIDGACASACTVGYDNCSGDYRCETDTTNSVKNCSACGAECPADEGTPWCRDSECGFTACPTGTGDCDGDGTCETDLDSSNDNCGACGNACLPQDGTGACVAGVCEIVDCDDQFGDCDGKYDNGCEQSLATLEHCGACRAACVLDNASATCETGTCTFGGCNTNFGNCDTDNRNGCETDLRSTVTHCGACDSPCALDNAVAECVASACGIAECDSGYEDCNGYLVDGCEAALLTDEFNCGTCDNSCSVLNMTTCTGGECGTCASGFGDCTSVAGCETPTTADPNCGECDNDCSGATPRCSDGACATSLIANGDFESNTNDWFTWSTSNFTSTMGRSNTTAHSGSWSLTVSGNSVGPAAIDLQGRVQSGQSYEFSFWVNLGGATSASVHVTRALVCGSDAPEYIWITTDTDLTAGVWTEIRGTLDVPPSAECSPLTTLRLYVEGVVPEGTTGNFVLFVDDVTLGQ